MVQFSWDASHAIYDAAGNRFDNLAPGSTWSYTLADIIAPTILTLLGLNPLALQAVQIEHTKVLPAFDPAEIAVTSSSTPSKLSSTVQLTNGQSQFQLSAEAVETFTIEASTDLENWAPIGTNSVAVGGSAVVTDPNASSYPSRFYRAVAK